MTPDVIVIVASGGLGFANHWCTKMATTILEYVNVVIGEQRKRSGMKDFSIKSLLYKYSMFVFIIKTVS